MISSFPMGGRSKAAGFASLALGLLLLAACGGNRVANEQQPRQGPPPASQPAAAPGKTTVGLLLPLSGPEAAVGQAMLQAAELAVFDQANANFELLVRDTQGSPEGARLAASSALASGASLLLGPLFGSSVPAAASEARSRRVSLLAFSNDVSVAAPGVFVLGNAPRYQVERVVGYASSRGLRRFAVLAPDDGYGRTVVAAMQAAVQRQGGEMSRVVFYNPAGGDLNGEVRRLADYEERQAALAAQRRLLSERQDQFSRQELESLRGRDTLGPPPFEALMLPLGGQALLAMGPLLSFYDVDSAEVQLLGTGLWDDPSLASEPALHGGWYTALAPDRWRDFSNRYAEAFGSPPPRVASLAYDATALAAILARQAEERREAPDYSAGNLSRESGFSGVDGLFLLRPSGETSRALAVMALGPGGPTVVDPAPTSLEQLAF